LGEEENMEKGELIFVTEGAYEDYHVEGHYRALRSVDDGEMFRNYIKGRETTPMERSMNGEHPAYSSDEFLPWAVENGYLEPIPVRKLDLGAYGELDPELYCRCESRTDAIVGDQDHEKHWWIPFCDFCDRAFPDERRPATDEEVWAKFPWMRPKE
jgi:hypothetical protein